MLHLHALELPAYIRGTVWANGTAAAQDFTTETFDAAGNVIGRADYEPFGAPIAATMTGTRPRQQFTGQERDGEEGVDYLGARLYLPGHGWTQLDELRQGI